MRMRRNSSTSRKPSVVMSPVRAPRRSRIALVATVVAWTTSLTSLPESFASAQYSAMPSTIACE